MVDETVKRLKADTFLFGLAHIVLKFLLKRRVKVERDMLSFSTFERWITIVKIVKVNIDKPVLVYKRIIFE